jgi:hypothetical protein
LLACTCQSYNLYFGIVPIYWAYLLRLPPKSGPLLVLAALGSLRCRSSSHRRSTFHFPCVLSCFSSNLVSFPSIICCVFNPLFPPRLCVGLFIVSSCARQGFEPNYLVILIRWVLLLNCSWLLPSSTLLRLTSLPPITHPLHYTVVLWEEFLF